MPAETQGKAQQVGTLKPQYEDQSLHLSSRMQTGLLSLTLIPPALGGRDRKASGAGTHTSYKLGGGEATMFCQWSKVENARGRHPVPFSVYNVFVLQHCERINVMSSAEKCHMAVLSQYQSLCDGQTSKVDKEKTVVKAA